jgi:3-methyladenine DNA glycosylase Mpg
VTVDAHRPEGHLAYIAMSFDKWRSALNPKVDVLVTAAIAETPNEKRERTRVMDKVRRLLRLYGEGRLIAAIGIATTADALTIKNVGNLLKNNRDAANDIVVDTPRGIDPQSNVRGAGYFERDLKKKGDEQ